MEKREAIKLYRSSDNEGVGLFCDVCGGVYYDVFEAVDELGNGISLCERCVEDPEQLDDKLEQKAAQAFREADIFLKCAIRLRAFKGRITASAMEAAKEAAKRDAEQLEEWLEEEEPEANPA
jgi:hypothetical protein